MAMAKEEELQASDEAPVPAPRRRFRKLRGALLTILLGTLGLAGGLVAAMGPRDALALIAGAPDPTAEMAAGEAAGHGAAGQKLVVTPFQEIIVNITATTATGRQTTRFLKMNIALVYDGMAVGSENVEARKLYLRDSFQDYLRQLGERDVQGSYGIAMLKSELLRRARAISASEAPQDILISDLIVQ
jgi:flagellar FliL protein